MDSRRRSRRIILTILGAILAFVAAVFFEAWWSTGRVIDRARQHCDVELARLRSERVYRPNLFEPEEEGDTWDVLKPAVEICHSTWTHATWSPFFTDALGRLNNCQEDRERLLESLAPVIEELKRGLRRRLVESDVWSDHTLTNRVNFLGMNRALGVLNGAILHREAQGRVSEVVDFVLICLGLADRLKVNGTTWDEMEAAHGDKVGFRAIRRLLMAPALAPSELAKLAMALEKLEPRAGSGLLDIQCRSTLESHLWILRALDGEVQVREDVERFGNGPKLRHAYS